MKRQLLSLSFLALALLGVLIIGASLGLAQTVDNPRPTPTPVEPTEPLEPRPSPVPAGPDIPLMPDLVVEEIRVVPPSPLINEEATILVTIKNVGPLDVRVDPPNNFWSDLYIDPSVVPIQLGQDGEASWGCQAIWMCSGCSRTLVTTWTFNDVKTYALYAQVDTDGHVAEGNENNNVAGPLNISVVSRDLVRHQTHQGFQNGVASGLDLSHPDGVIRRGIFDEPDSEPGVYTPDWMVNSITGTLPTNVNQVKPSLTGDGQNRLFAAWEDGRNGGVYNRDIYFSSAVYPWENWGADIKINDDGGLVNQVSPALAYDQSRSRLYAVWQDGRNGDFDIYFAYSDNNGGTWSANQQLSIDPINSPDADQLNPSITVGPSKSGGGDAVYVAWQDQRNGNDDVYIIRSGDGGASWGPPYFVTDDPDMTAQSQVAPSVGVDGLGQVFVTWEDWRDPSHPEIYVSWSWDQGVTFGVDVPVSIPGEGTSYRVQPAMVVDTSREIVEEWDPQLGITVEVEIDITAIHVAWQQGQGVNADIYYGYATFDYYDPDLCPWPYDFCFEGTQKIDGFVIDSDYALPPDTGPTWSIEPSWQGGATMTPASGYDVTWCHADSPITYTKGVFVAWSDGRSYDDWRYEIHTRRIASPLGDPKAFEPCEDQSTGVVNDNAKIYAYRNDLDVYRVFKPAATRQLDPSIFAVPPSTYTYDSLVAVAWDDDRWDRPLEPNTVRNRDIFMTKTGDRPPQGIYISDPIDSQTEATWYVLSWYAVTQHAGDVLFQTRFGSTPYPPHDDVAANGWTRWTGNPSSTSVGCLAGVGCYYDAPGRHIVGPGGNDWPESRYIQYKVIINGSNRITAVSQVTIHYEGPFSVSLPGVMKRER